MSILRIAALGGEVTNTLYSTYQHMSYYLQSIPVPLDIHIALQLVCTNTGENSYHCSFDSRYHLVKEYKMLHLSWNQKDWFTRQENKHQHMKASWNLDIKVIFYYLFFIIVHYITVHIIIQTTTGHELFCDLTGSPLAGYQLISSYQRKQDRLKNIQRFANEKIARHSILTASTGKNAQ